MTFPIRKIFDCFDLSEKLKEKHEQAKQKGEKNE